MNVEQVFSVAMIIFMFLLFLPFVATLAKGIRDRATVDEIFHEMMSADLGTMLSHNGWATKNYKLQK
ncbi:MAG: hypothetical protein WC238_05125 [Parcubacteria group bacterium]|jgi:hypothetical protein